MKDSEFIELLNLYLDHEISAADAARLESEVQGSAARRRIYQQYCCMQKACKVLAVDFQTEVPASNVVPFEPADDDQAPARKARASGLYAWGSVAAAACVALALFSRSGNSTGGASPAETAQNGPVIAVTAPAATPASTAQQLLLANQTQEADARFAWMNEVQLTPLQSPQQLASDTLRFDVKAQPPQPGVYNSAQPLEVDEHMSAFRFQK